MGLRVMALVVFSVLSTLTVRAQEPVLRIDVAHAQVERADVRVGLYTDPSNWLDDEPVLGMVEAATDTLTTVVFDELPAGTYGAAIYLDENRNGKLDRNLIGLFKEPFGFSMEARARFGPPRWTDAVFTVGQEPTRLLVRLD